MIFIFRALTAAIFLFLVEGGLRPTLGGALSALLVSVVLCWWASRSRASGAELVAAMAGFDFVVSSVATIPEGVLFDVIKVGQAPLMMLKQLGVALVLAVVVAALFGRLRPAPAATVTAPTGMSVLGLLWRLAAAVAVWTVCYAGAGMLIFPFVKDYYAVRAMPSPGAILATQVLRALCLVAAGWPLLRGVSSRLDGRLILATALPVIGIISLMLHENDLMPPFVRWVHTLETVPYYALFGLLVAVWFGPRGVSGDSAVGTSSAS
jgi:hypothetical protein